MSGYQYWLGTTENRGFWQSTGAHTDFAVTNIPDGSTIELCSRGNLPYLEWDGFNVRQIAHAAPTYGFNFGAEFTYGDWTCVQQELDMRYANNTIQIGHHYAASGRQNPGQLWPPGTPGVIPAARFSWQVWVKSINGYEFPEPENSLPDRMTYSSGRIKGGPGVAVPGADPRGCAITTCEGATGYAGDPINTRTGGFDYSAVDISIPSLAGPLVFQRFYNSIATQVFTSTLGYGWTHNHDIRLIFPEDPGGETGAVLFQSSIADRFKFITTAEGSYIAEPGLTASLTRQPGPPLTYTLIDRIQSVYTFDEVGKLLTWTDALGKTWNYTYDLNGRLERVSAGGSQAFLDLEYDGQGRVTSVVDQTGRGVSFGYDPAGDLTSFTDVLNDTWTNTYDGAHRLRLVEDPGQSVVIHTEFDALGRAYQQYDGNNNLLLDVAYNQDGTATIQDGLGNSELHVYDSRNTLTGQNDALGGTTEKLYEGNFRPILLSDENGHETQLIWSPDGANLTKMVDAQGNRTDLQYDGLNNLTAIIDPRSFLTTYIYSGTLMISSTDALSNTITYDYTTAADAPQPPDLLKAITDPLGNITHFTYNEYGQQLSVTDPLSNTTTFTYDSVGRPLVTHDPAGQANWTCYDAADRVVRTVVNASGDGSTSQSDPCDAVNYLPSTDPSFDQVATTVYDEHGNAIATIGPDGSITRTYYDTNNRPVTVIQNLTGQAVENPTPPARNPATPAENVRTDSVYDINGNLIASVAPNGIVTRTYYDANNRPAMVVQNLVGQAIEVATPPAYDPDFPDRNVRTQTTYDATGNIIASVDPNGIVTRTYYDANNRPVTVVQNLVGQTVENPTPPTFNPTYPDRNVRTDTVYDPSGNVIATIDPKSVITRTYYDPLNRPETIVENLVGQAIEVSTPPAYNPAYPDRNVRSDYVYDPAGNTIAVIDPLSRITRTYFDANNRPVMTVRNLTDHAIANPDPPAYNPAYPDQNVITETVYAASGNPIAAIDPRGVITRIYYDPLNRPVTHVQNLSGQSVGSPTPPVFNPLSMDQNVRTDTVYDGQGDRIATVANDGAITRTYYDRLHRAVFVVRNLSGQAVEAAARVQPRLPGPEYPLGDGLRSLRKRLPQRRHAGPGYVHLL